MCAPSILPCGGDGQPHGRITKKGRPVAKLVPADNQPDDIFGCLKDKIKIVGDIESPITPLEDWDALC